MSPKLPPRPCVCGNKGCQKQPENGLTSSKCSREAPCHLADYFQKLEWEKLKKKNVRARSPQKQPCFLKVPAW